MKNLLLILLCFLCNFCLVNAQDFASQSFRFQLKEKSKVSSQIVKPTLFKTTPFIALSAVVKGVNTHEEIQLFVWAAPDGETKKRWLQLTHDHDFESNNEVHFPPIYLSSSTKNFRFKLLKTKTSQAKEVYFNAFVPADVLPQETPATLNEQSGGARACSCAQPSSVSRSSWGSSYSLTANSSCSSVSYTTVTHLIVHHAAGSNTSSNWAAVVASIWNYHVNSNGWCDIGYNWLIDPNGVLYVGRGGGNNVVGAHMCGYNQKTMGVCMLGDYNTATPSTASMNKLTELLAWKCCNSNINPLGSGTITSYPGTMNNISGHKDGCAPGYTDCPGTNLYNQLSALRVAVDNYINNGCSFSAQSTQPINDYCSGAIDLTSQTTCNYQSFSTIGATGSLPATSPCNGFTNGNADDDVWFTFTAVANQHSVQVLNGTNFDGVVDVRNGCYSSSVSIGCDDQTGSTGVLNTVTLNNLTIGTTYYVRVYHYGSGSGGGNFQICITHPQPTCNAPGGRVTNNITATGAQLSWNAANAANNYEVWYKQAGSSTYTKVSTTSTTLNISNLNCNTNYEWGVITYCSNGTNSGAPASFSTFTTLNDLPTANIQHTASGYDVNFTTATTGNPTIFSWDFGDGSPLSTLQNPTHTYPATGVATNYTVSLTITNYCGTRTITYPFTLIPNCNFSLSQNTAFIDSNFQTLNVQLNNAANCPWTATTNCQFVAVAPASGSGTTNVSITISENNDTTQRTCTIEIAGEFFTIIQAGKKAPVNCTFALVPDTAIIDSNAQHLNIQLNNPTNCNWNIFSACNFVSVSPQTGSGTQTIQINTDANLDTSTRVCNILIADKNFVLIQHGKQPPVPPKDPCVPALPAPPIVANGCDLASTPAIPNVGYSWFKNGNLLLGATSRFFTVEDDKGYYYVVITDTNNCTAQSVDLYVDCTQPPLKINEIDAPFFTIMPNPASQEFTILCSEKLHQAAKLQVIDALGKIVFEDKAFLSSSIISALEWASGVYFVSLKHDDKKIIQKLLVKH